MAGWGALVPLIVPRRGLVPRAASLGLLAASPRLSHLHWLFEVPGFGWTQAPILASRVAYCTLLGSASRLYRRIRHCY